MRNEKEEKIKILYLCTGNSCRSQMAEALTNFLKGDFVKAYSADVDPKGVDSRAVKVMAELGIDISGQKSKSVDEIIRMDIDFDYVITLCDNARKSCPVFPARATVFHVGFDDLCSPCNGGFFCL
ncbi:MAG TPA: arsenate reductase ArsC [Deltaproteobacteria bacterium]|nr:arsenate reductase ArsC [Deltaproteobacteria bacterium]